MPRAPAEPGALALALTSLLRFFTTGNLVAKVGVMVLFVGVAFLVKYSIDHALLPPALRLAGAALLGIGLLGVGFRLRTRADAYGLLLQGAGIGVLYLAVFAGLRLYGLVPPGLAFALLVAIVVASSALAVLQDSEAMAAFGLAGGFLAPVLTSTGSGSHVALFSYYVLLNLGILGMAWFRSWRWVNLLGFVFTFVIGTLWGRSAYQPSHFASVEAFLIYFFLHYLVVSVLFARGVALRQAALAGVAGVADAAARRLSAAVNGTLVFGLPICAFGLQSALVEGRPFALAYSALGMAAAYVAALYVARRWRAVPELLGDSYLALALVFASLAIPFAVADQRWTAAAWAVEGAGLVWIGLRQQRLFNRAFGLLLQPAAAVAFARAVLEGDSDGSTGFALACAMLALSAWGISWLYAQAALHGGRVRLPALVSGLATLWAWPWWIAATIAEVLELSGDAQPWRFAGVSIVLALSVAGVATLGARHAWPAGRRSGYAWLPALGVFVAIALDDGAPLAVWPQWLAWLSAFAAALVVLRALDAGADATSTATASAATPGAPTPGVLTPAGPDAVSLWHTLTLLGLVAIACMLAFAQGREYAAWDSGWLHAIAGVLPLAVLWALPNQAGRWPVRAWPAAYLEHAAAALAVWLVVWVALFGWVRGDPAPLPFVPFANPLELAQCAALLGAWRALNGIGSLREALPSLPVAVVGGAAFVLANEIALRALHYFAGVPYAAADMAASATVQSTLSLLWTLCALGAMFLAARRGARALWLAGAVLLGAVVLKLLLVDLSDIGTVARIVSFMGVGGLMLLIGYLAPLPPPRTAAADASGQAPGEGPSAVNEGTG